LVDLELFFQLLNQGREFLLPFRFDLLPQRSLYFSALLDIAGFKLSPFLRVQVEPRVANRRLSLAPDGLTAQILSLPHDISLFGTHSYPALGVALEILAR
jgi:hypothetical protein